MLPLMQRFHMPRRFRRTCECCKWKHYMVDGYGDVTAQTICDQCSSHYRQKLEPAERTLARETAHAAMWRKIALDIGASFDRQAVDLENEKLGAFNNRERKRYLGSILDELSDLHQGGEKNRCTCGLMWPCTTAVLLERRYGKEYARHKVAAEAERQRLIQAGLNPDRDDGEELLA